MQKHTNTYVDVGIPLGSISLLLLWLPGIAFGIPLVASIIEDILHRKKYSPIFRALNKEEFNRDHTKDQIIDFANDMKRDIEEIAKSS